MSDNWKYFLESPPKIIATRAQFKLVGLNLKNLKELKKVNRATLPVSYSDRFYFEILAGGEELTKLAYYNDNVAGAIACEIDENVGRRLYIMTLGCLSQYRRLGVGSMLMQYVLSYAENNGTFDSVYLHVNTVNDIAMKLYKKFGFKITEFVKHYYGYNVKDADAFIMERRLHPKKLNGRRDHHSINNKNN